jgi:hypothetical protein
MVFVLTKKYADFLIVALNHKIIDKEYLSASKKSKRGGLASRISFE